MPSYLNEPSIEAPVEYMRLFVHVRTFEPLRVSAMAGFTETWSETYPEIEEQPPLPTYDREREFEFLDEDDYWPMPFTTLRDPAAGCGIMFQADRIGVFWERTEQPNSAPYPGFEKMKNRLLEVLGDFVKVAENAAAEVQSTRVECVYENFLTDILPAECMLGRMTNWDQRSSLAELDPAATFDIHDHSKAFPGLPAWISLRPVRDEKATRLVIRAVVDNKSQQEPVLDISSILDTARQVAREQYTYWVPPNIRNNAEEV